MLDIKKLLKIVKLSSVITLKDGTEVQVEGDADVVGSKVFVSLPNVDNPVPLPDGKYVCDDDSELIIKDGMIESITEPKTEDEVAVEKEIEAEAPIEAADAPVDTPNEPPKPDLETKVQELEDRLKAIEDALASNQESQKLSSEKLQNDFSALLERLEKTDGTTKLSSQKIPVVTLTPSQIRYKAMKTALKNN